MPNRASKRLLVMVTAIALTMSAFGAALASLSQNIVYEEDFSSDTGDWKDSLNDGDGFYGSIVHNPGAETATIDGADGALPLGPYSFFGTIEDRTEWPEHGYLTELDIYLDPSDTVHGDGFDLSVASYSEAGVHLRDFIIHLGNVDGALLVNGSNNSDWSFNAFKLDPGSHEPATITDAGWYTFQHSFYDNGGTLAVDLKVLDSEGHVVFSATRTTNDEIDGDVGYVGYMWFVYASAPFDIDNQLLANYVPAPEDKRDCMKGGYVAFGFDNQGQCIASLQANEKAGK